DLAHRGEGLLVAPYRVFGVTAVGDDAEITGVALVRAMRLMTGALKQAHVGIAARNIENRLVACFLEREGVARISDRAAGKDDAHAVGILGNRDRMVGPGEFHGASFASWIIFRKQALRIPPASSLKCGRPGPPARIAKN